MVRKSWNKPPKASNPQNQGLLDRLCAMKDAAGDGPKTQSYRKAVGGLRDHKDAVSTNADAMKVHGVGKGIAGELFGGAADAAPNRGTVRHTTAASTTASTVNAAASKTLFKPKDYEKERLKLDKELQSAIKESYRLHNGDDLVDPSEWQVVMLADYREQLPAIQKRCESEGVPFVSMRLAIGDYIIAAVKKSEIAAGNAKNADYIVLGPIVERKTPADLARSIKASRWQRQKTDMDNTNVRDLVLLMEGDTGMLRDDSDRKCIDTAEAEVRDDAENPCWSVLTTNGPDNTGQVLVQLYWEAVEKFRRHQFDYAVWYNGRASPLTLVEIKAQHASGQPRLQYSKQLQALGKGLGEAKAKLIMHFYPTPTILYEHATNQEDMATIAALRLPRHLPIGERAARLVCDARREMASNMQGGPRPSARDEQGGAFRRGVDTVTHARVQQTDTLRLNSITEPNDDHEQYTAAPVGGVSEHTTMERALQESLKSFTGDKRHRMKARADSFASGRTRTHNVPAASNGVTYGTEDTQQAAVASNVPGDYWDDCEPGALAWLYSESNTAVVVTATDDDWNGWEKVPDDLLSDERKPAAALTSNNTSTILAGGAGGSLSADRMLPSSSFAVSASAVVLPNDDSSKPSMHPRSLHYSDRKPSTGASRPMTNGQKAARQIKRRPDSSPDEQTGSKKQATFDLDLNRDEDRSDTSKVFSPHWNLGGQAASYVHGVDSKKRARRQVERQDSSQEPSASGTKEDPVVCE